MADDSSEPTLEIRVVGDFSEFDRETARRESSEYRAGITFGTPGGGGGGRALDQSRAQQASDRLADALNRQAQAVERMSYGFTSHNAIPYYASGSARARDPETGRFTSAGANAANYPLAPYTAITRATFNGPAVQPQMRYNSFAGGGYRMLPAPADPDIIDAEWSPSGPQAANTGWANSGGGGGALGFGGGGGGGGGLPAGPNGGALAGGGGFGGGGGRGGFGAMGYGGGGGGGGKGFRGLSDFYMRFLALEGIRMVAGLADSYRKNSLRQMMARGDYAMLADSDLQLRTDIASEIPFGIGKLGVFLRDPTGSEEASVRLPLAQAASTDARTTSMVETGRMVQQYQRDAATAGSVGVAREIHKINNTYVKKRLEIQDSLKSRNEEITKQMLEGISDENSITRYKSKWGRDLAQGRYLDGWGLSLPFTSFLLGQEDDGSIRARNISGIQAGARNRRRVAQQQANAADAAARAEAAAQADEARRYVGYDEKQNYNTALDLYDDAQFTLTRSARAQLSMKRRHELELKKAQRETPELVASIQMLQATEWQAMISQQGREQRAASIQFAGIVNASAAVLNRNPLAATAIQIHSQTMAALATADPADRNRILTEGLLKVMQAYQQYKDNTSLERMGIAADLKRQRILAEAYGPGARARRMEADVGTVVDSSERNAQELLRRDSTRTKDAGDLRQTGIERLKGMKAQFLQAISAQEGNINRIAFQGEGSSNIGSILQQINVGIQTLVGKLGGGISE